MDHVVDFEERLAARLLGLPVGADPLAIRGRFRSLVKAVHPDKTLLQGCVDLGSLADARDLLLARAERRGDHGSDAREHLEAMRLAPRSICAEVVHPAASWRPRRSMVTQAFEPRDRVGTLIDLAG